MNVAVLYLLLLKGTVTAFAGLASLPVIQDEFVIQHHVLTDTQLNEAVVITRSTPGAVGLYIVSVGYFVAGVPGAIAGWLAMITPALLIIPLGPLCCRPKDGTSTGQIHLADRRHCQFWSATRGGETACTRRTHWPGHRSDCGHQLRFIAYNQTGHALDYPRRGAMLVVGGFTWHSDPI